MKSTPEQYVDYIMRSLGNTDFIYGPPLLNMYGYASIFLGYVFQDYKFMYGLIVKFIKEKSIFHPKSNALHTM